jgi:hypothetical protein
MIIINLKAKSSKVKQLNNSSLTIKSILLKEPNQLNSSDIKEGAITTVDLSTIE